MKNAKKKLVLLICITLLAGMLSACSGGSDGEPEPTYDGEPETTVVRLALHPNGHIFNVIAEEKGYLADEGISVEYVRIETDEEAFEGIANGTIDVASNQGTNLPLQKISEGMDLTIFGGYLLTGCMPVFGRADTEWTGIESLIGKRVACEPNVYAITGPLLDMGYDPLNQIEWIETETQAERIEAVKNGDADFGLVGTDLNYAINSDPDLKVMTYASDVMPDYSCCRVEASTEWVNQNPNTVKRLLKAWIRAMAYYDAHHDEAVYLLMDVVGRDEEYVRAYLDNPHCDLNIDPMDSAVERAWSYMDRLGLLSPEAQEIDIRDHINTKIYKAALDECQEQYGDENPKFYERMQAQYAINN